jgi:hypothetical protein
LALRELIGQIKDIDDLIAGKAPIIVEKSLLDTIKDGVLGLVGNKKDKND